MSDDSSPNPVSTASMDELARHEVDKIAQLANEQAKKILKKIPALGPVAWLMIASPTTRHTLVSELEWRVMPAIVLDQAKLYMREESPVGFVSWAKLSEPVVQRYREAPHHLVAADWTSGDQIWLIDVLTPFGGAHEVLRDLRENVFKGQVIRRLLPRSEKTAQVMTWSAL